MRREKLCIKECKTCARKMIYEMGESEFATACCTAEHAFTKKGAAQSDAVSSADQRAILPYLEGMGKASGVKLCKNGLNLGVDPRVFAISAGQYNTAKVLIYCMGIAAFFHLFR